MSVYRNRLIISAQPSFLQRVQAHTRSIQTVGDEVSPAEVLIGNLDMELSKIELHDALPDH
jgi:hypothetical protein